MKLFGGPTIAQMREKMLYQAECELLQAESMKEAYDAQVRMLKARICRLKTGANIILQDCTVHGQSPSKADFAYLFGGDREKIEKIVNGDWPDLSDR